MPVTTVSELARDQNARWADLAARLRRYVASTGGAGSDEVAGMYRVVREARDATGRLIEGEPAEFDHDDYRDSVRESVWGGQL